MVFVPFVCCLRSFVRFAASRSRALRLHQTTGWYTAAQEGTSKSTTVDPFGAVVTQCPVAGTPPTFHRQYEVGSKSVISYGSSRPTTLSIRPVLAASICAGPNVTGDAESPGRPQRSGDEQLPNDINR